MPSMVAFPALMFVLGNVSGAAIIANATNTVALCPGAFLGAKGAGLFDLRIPGSALKGLLPAKD